MKDRGDAIVVNGKAVKVMHAVHRVEVRRAHHCVRPVFWFPSLVDGMSV